MRIKKYDGFISENMDQAKSIIGKKMAAFDKLKVLLSKNLGYIGKFTEYLMEENVAYEDLVELYDKILDLKGRSTAIDISTLSYEKALDKIIELDNDLVVNSLLSKFPSLQKNLIKERITRGSTKFSFNSMIYNVLLKVAKKENVQTLISKISRYKDFNTLDSALKLFSKDPKNSKEQVKQLINDIKSDIVFENDNILVVKVDSLADINLLGPDTSWCILGSGQWNNYTRNRLQYIVYDYTKDEFDPKFKIGFTLNKDGSVHAAHDILDGSALGELRTVLNDNSITYKDLLPKAEVVDVAQIDSINSRTGTESIKLLIDSILVDDKEAISKLITKLFDVFGYMKKGRNGVTNRELTTTKKNILIKLINKYFIGVSVITTDSFKDLDERISKFAKDSYMFNERFVDCTIGFNFGRFNNAAASYALDVCTDQIIVDSTFGIYDFIGNGTIDYMKPIPDEKLGKSREVLNKLCDRLNKIYKENKVNFTYKNAFEFKMLFLNCILGREDDCPDKDLILSRVSAEKKGEFPGLFSKEIDLESTRLAFSNFSNKDYPIDLIEVKDYPVTKTYITDYGLLNQIPKIIRHLKDKELMLNIRRDTFRDIIRRDQSYKNKLDEEGLRVYNLLKSFPARVYKDTYKTDGNLKVVVRE
jgi:hypothetical protein